MGLKNILVLITVLILSSNLGLLTANANGVGAATDCESVPTVTYAPPVFQRGYLATISGKGFGTNANYRPAGRVMIGGRIAQEPLPEPVIESSADYYVLSWQDDRIQILPSAKAPLGVQQVFVLVSGRYAEFVVEVK